MARSGLTRNLSNTRIGASQGPVRVRKRQSGDFTWNKHNEADYDMVKLALNSVDLVILHSLVQQAMKPRPTPTGSGWTY